MRHSNRHHPRKTCSFAIAATLGFSLSACDKEHSATPQIHSTPASTIPVGELTVHQRVAKQISDLLKKPISEITQEKNLFSDLGADSLDAVEIVMAVEEEFNITIDDASAERMKTVADIVAYIEKHPKP